MTAIAAEWQRGYSLDYLRQFTNLFATCLRPHVYGAFGVPNESEVAAALSDGTLVWHAGDGQEEVAIVAIAAPLRSRSTRRDFTGEAINVAAGTLAVSPLAARPDVTPSFVASFLRSLTSARPILVEIYEECAALRSGVLEAGLAYVGTRVTAGGEVKGLYAGPGAAQPPPLGAADRATLVCLRRDFLSEAEHAAILGEVDRYAAWAQHYSSYNKRRSWTAFALVGYDAEPGFIIKPAEMSKAWREENPAYLRRRPGPTAASLRFPRTMEVARRAARGFDRLRFMRLAAQGGELTRHADITDREAGTRDGQIARLHIPIRTTPSVRFVAWDHRGTEIACAPQERALYYLDQRKPHAVRNPGAIERIHLVIDAVVDASLRDAIACAAPNE